MTRRLSLLLAIFAPAMLGVLSGVVWPAAAQAGVWLPAEASANGLGGWWELRADGSATYNWGAMAEARYTVEGSVLTVIPGGGRTDRPRFRVRFKDDRLFTRTDETGSREAEYRRTGWLAPGATPGGKPAPLSTGSVSATNASGLIGQWASVPVPKAAMPAMPDMPDMPGMTGPAHDMPSVRTFTADGVYKVRIVYSARQGRWSAANATVQVDGEPLQPFVFKAGSLTVAGVVFHPE